MNIFKSFKEARIPWQRRREFLINQFDKPALLLIQKLLLSVTLTVTDSVSALNSINASLSWRVLSFVCNDSVVLLLWTKHQKSTVILFLGDINIKLWIIYIVWYLGFTQKKPSIENIAVGIVWKFVYHAKKQFFLFILKVGVSQFTQDNREVHCKNIHYRDWNHLYTDLCFHGDGFGKHRMMITAESTNSNPLKIAGNE